MPHPLPFDRGRDRVGVNIYMITLSRRGEKIPY